jgi:hypothetical protein
MDVDRFLRDLVKTDFDSVELQMFLNKIMQQAHNAHQIYKRVGTYKVYPGKLRLNFGFYLCFNETVV